MNALACVVEQVGLHLRGARLDADISRTRAHLDDGDPAVRKHARDWLRQLEAERLVLGRWQSELALPAMVCTAHDVQTSWPPRWHGEPA